MDEVVVVHVLCAEQVAVLSLAQVLRVDAIGSQELLVGHTEGLSNRLRDKLGLGHAQRTDDTGSHRLTQAHTGRHRQTQARLTLQFIPAEEASGNKKQLLTTPLCHF